MVGKEKTFRERQMEKLYYTHQTARGWKCDCCGNHHGSDMHEIFPRGSTLRDSEAREASYQLELVALLCRDCHLHCADTEQARDYYLAGNIKRYGLKRVVEAYNKLNDLMVLDRGVDLEGISQTHYPSACRKTEG